MINPMRHKKSPNEGALHYFLESHGLYIPPSAKSMIAAIIGNGPTISKKRAAGRTALFPVAGLVFWQSVILPPRIVPQLLINKQVARDKTITFFMGFYCFFTHALMSGYLFMQRRTYSLTFRLRYSYDLCKKIKQAHAVGCITLVAFWRLRVSRRKDIAERYNCNTNIEFNCNTNII